MAYGSKKPVPLQPTHGRGWAETRGEGLGPGLGLLAEGTLKTSKVLKAQKEKDLGCRKGGLMQCGIFDMVLSERNDARVCPACQLY